MIQKWSIDGKQGNVWFPEGEVIYQTPKPGTIVIQSVYKDFEDNYYIEENGKLLPTPMNPFNGYCYRQDGK